MGDDAIAGPAPDRQRALEGGLGQVELPQPVAGFAQRGEDASLPLAPGLIRARQGQGPLVELGGRARLDASPSDVAGPRQRLDGAFGDVAFPRVEVQRCTRGLLQMERDRSRIAVGGLAVRQLVRDAQMESLALPLCKRVVGHVPQDVGAEPPQPRAVFVLDQQAVVLGLGQQLLARLDDQ